MLASSAAAASGQTSSENHGGFFSPQVNLDGEALFSEVGKFIVEKLPEPADGAAQKDIFDSLENGIVTAALRRTNGNKQAAANLLGLYRPRLYGMIKRHNIEEKKQKKTIADKISAIVFFVFRFFILYYDALSSRKVWDDINLKDWRRLVYCRWFSLRRLLPRRFLSN